MINVNKLLLMLFAIGQRIRLLFLVTSKNGLNTFNGAINID